MSDDDPAAILGYDARWIEFGLVDRSYLESQLRQFRRSDDKNTEHYRAAAFRVNIVRALSQKLGAQQCA